MAYKCRRSSLRTVSSGIPQGSNLEPLLYTGNLRVFTGFDTMKDLTEQRQTEYIQVLNVNISS